jgi:hypothetical protein
LTATIAGSDAAVGFDDVAPFLLEAGDIGCCVARAGATEAAAINFVRPMGMPTSRLTAGMERDVEVDCPS